MASPNEADTISSVSAWETAGFVLIVAVVALLTAVSLLWANRKARASAHDVEMGKMRTKLHEAAGSVEEHKSALQAMDVHLHDTLEHVAYRARVEEVLDRKLLELQCKVESLQAANRALTGQDDFQEDEGRDASSAPTGLGSRPVIADIVLAQGPDISHCDGPRSLEDELAAATVKAYNGDPFVVGDEEDYVSSENLHIDCRVDNAASGVSTLQGEVMKNIADSDAASVVSKYHRDSVVVEEMRPVTIAHVQAQSIVVLSDG